MPKKRETKRPRAEDSTQTAVDLLDAKWQEFYSTHRDKRLSGPAHYALPDELLAAIRAEVPNLLTDEDLRFEEEFACRAPFGIFLGQPIGTPVDCPRVLHELDKKAVEATNQIRSMLDVHRQSLGVDSYDLREAWSRHAEHVALVHEKRQAYIGWLVSQEAFRHELSLLHDQFQGHVEQWGRFPTLSMLQSQAHGDHFDYLDRPETALFHFYQKWALHQLLTWDWPFPLCPLSAKRSSHPRSDSVSSGIDGLSPVVGAPRTTTFGAEHYSDLERSFGAASRAGMGGATGDTVEGKIGGLF